MNRANYNREERRRHARQEETALTIAFDGASYVIRSWSLGGFMVEDYEGRLSPGALFTVESVGGADGEMWPVAIRSRVVRADAFSRRLMVSFLDIDDRGYHVLQTLMAERMRALRDQSF